MNSRWIERAKRVVVYRVGSLGDTLVVLPAFHLVRRAFPMAHITLLTSFPITSKAAQMELILQHTGVYDDTMRYPTSLRDWRALLKLLQQLRAGKYDCLVYLAKPKGGLLTSIRDYLFFRFCGIPHVVGIPFSKGELHAQRIAGSEMFRAETVRTMESLRALGSLDLAEDSAWDLRFTPGEEREAADLLKNSGVGSPFLAASVGTKMQANDWEEHNWRALINRISALYPELPLVLFGVEEERDRSDRMLAEWRGPSANLCGKATPRVSAALLRRAHAMICHDSGPMHLAATVGVPCIAIFSARGNPGEWYPRGDFHTIVRHQTPCWGCKLEVCIVEKKKCILSISVDEVFAAVRESLTRLGVSAKTATDPQGAF